MVLSAVQCRAARDLLGWTLEDLAHAAGVSIFTVRDFERDKRIPDTQTLTLMRRAFEGAGIEFGPAERGDAGVRLANTRH
jgi:transcriptional regulator with XRE-family HTH domain